MQEIISGYLYIFPIGFPAFIHQIARYHPYKKNKIASKKFSKPPPHKI